MTWRKKAAAVIASAALALGVPGAVWADLLVNGDFASSGGEGQLTVNTTLANWTGGGKEGHFGSQTTPPVFIFQPGSLQTGVNGDAFMGNVSFYAATPPPDGGTVIAADGDPDWKGSISQTVTGLTAGQTYTLAFNWAGAQQQNFSGDTTESWQVNFGGDTQFTSTVNTPSHTFVGWQSSTMTFTASSTSELLSFIANGSPSGEPPWLLLDGVTLNAAAVPEPSTVALLGLGLVGLGAFRRYRRLRAKAVSA